MENKFNDIMNMASALQLPEDLTAALSAYLKRDMSFVEAFYERNWSMNNLSESAQAVIAAKQKDGYLALLAFALLYTKETKRFYRQRKIDDSVFYDTMSDIRIWCENCRQKNRVLGLENIDWLRFHLRAELFRLGRLQFQICKMQLPDYVNDSALSGFDLKCGDDVLYVHIPQGESLAYEKCRESFEYSGRFFQRYFPNLHYRFGICESWLLYAGNSAFMKPSSNILHFAADFTMLGSAPHPEQAIERIWGEKQTDVSHYAEDTSLQKSAKEYLKNGGKLGEGFGIIDLTKFFYE